MLTAEPDIAAPLVDPRLPPLELLDARAGYGRIEVLHGIDLAVPRGQVAALLGPNGAGKSTALGVLSGLIRPTSGCRHVQGRHLNGAGADDLARIGICHVREGRSVFPNLSVEENLQLMSYAGVPAGAVLETAFAYFPRLLERRKQLAGTMSGGEQQMCAIGRALMCAPRILLLDEPSAGLAPLVVQQVFDLVRRIRQEGLTVLIVEQNVAQVLRVVDRAYVLETGRVAAEGRSAELAADPAIRRSYLGGH